MYKTSQEICTHFRYCRSLLCVSQFYSSSLRWRHNGRYSVSNHQPHDCFLNRLFRRRSKKTSKLCVTGLCVGNSPGTGEFPAQTASNAENVSIWWRHHASVERHWMICGNSSHKLVIWYQNQYCIKIRVHIFWGIIWYRNEHNVFTLLMEPTISQYILYVSGL